MTKCVFCRKEFKNIATLFNHYTTVHNIEKDDAYLKEHISYLYNKQKGRKTVHENTILCPSCASIYNSYKSLLKHKLRRHTQQIGGALEMDSLVTSSYTSTDVFSSYKIGISVENFGNEYDFYQVSVVDAFLANAKAQFDRMRQNAIVRGTDQNKSLKFNIVYVLINQKNEEGFHQISTPWSKTTDTFTGNGLFQNIVTNLSDSVKRSILVNNENGSAYYFRNFEKLELNVIETKNVGALGEIFGGKEKKINFSPITKETLASDKVKIFTAKPKKRRRKPLVVYSDSETEEEDDDGVVEVVKRKSPNKTLYVNSSVIDFETEVEGENKDEDENINEIEEDEMENHADFINDSSDEEVDINQLRILSAKNIFVENEKGHEEFNSDEESDGELEELTEEQEIELNEAGIVPNDKADEKKLIPPSKNEALIKEKEEVMKLLVRPQSTDGECIYESILNGLHYHYTSLPRIRCSLDDKIYEIPDEITSILSEYRESLRYLPKEEFIYVISTLNDELKTKNVYLNVFMLEDENAYIISDLNEKTEVLRGSAKEKAKKRIKRTVSYIKVLFLGIENAKVGNGGVQILDKNLKLVNLVVIPGKKENEVTYATEISKFFRCLVIGQEKKFGERASLKQVFACKSCLKLYINKPCFDKHEKVCNGPAAPQFKFDDRHIVTYKEYLNLYNPQPYSLYYDVETDSDAKKVIAYTTSVAFSLDMNVKSKNWYFYRHIHMNQRELTEYKMVPDSVLQFTKDNDKVLLSRSADNVVNNVGVDPLAAHMVLEHHLLDKWVRESQKLLLVNQNKHLSIKEKNEFKAKITTTNTQCCICRFPINLSRHKPENKLRDLPRIKFEIEQEYIRVLESVELGVYYLYLANLTEKGFIEKVITIVETMLLSKDIDSAVKMGISSLEDIQVHSKDLYQYLSKDGFKDLDSFIIFLRRRNTHGDFKMAPAIMMYEQSKQFPGWFSFTNSFFENIQSIYDDDNYVIHHDHFTRRIYGYAHPSCNSALQNPAAMCKTCIYAHNAVKFDLSFVRRGIKLSDWGSKDVHLHGSDRVDAITLSSRVTYRDTLKFFQESLADLVKSADATEQERIQIDIEKCLLTSDTFGITYMTLSIEDKKRVLELLLLKNAIPYDMFYNIENLKSTVFPEKEAFTSTLKNEHIDDKTYENTKELFYLLKCKDMHALVEVYSYGDIVFLTVIAQNRFYIMGEIYGNEPKNFSSLTMQSKASMLLMTKSAQSTPSNPTQVNLYETASFGGYAGTPIRCFFDSSVVNNAQPVYANIPNNDEGRSLVKKRVIKHIFKLDENNQYGKSMDQPLPVGAFFQLPLDKQIARRLLETYDRTKSDFGHVFVVDIRPPPNTKENQIYLKLAELYLPVFIRKAIPTKHLSLYQRREKKELRADKKGFKVIKQDVKTHSVYGLHRKVPMFIHTIQYLITALHWEVVDIYEHHTYFQKPFMSSYVRFNQDQRKKATSKVEQKLYKDANNKGYGAQGIRMDKAKLYPIFDTETEFDRFKKDNSKIGDAKNPFASAELFKSKKDREYDKAYDDIIKSDSPTLVKNLRKGLLRDEYDNDMKAYDSMKRKESSTKRAAFRSATKMVEEALKDKFTKSVVEYEDSNSITGVIKKLPQSIKSSTRPVLVCVTSYAKIQIATFSHAFGKVLFEETRSQDTSDKFKKLGMEEVIPELILTDTDSVAMGVTIIGDTDKCTISDKDSYEFFEKLIITQLSERLDLSNKYYEKYNMCRPDNWKNFGLYAFECSGDNKIVKIIAPNPKEYIECYINKKVKKVKNEEDDSEIELIKYEDDYQLKHKGIKRGTGGNDFRRYSLRIKDVYEQERTSNKVEKVLQTRFEQKKGDIRKVNIKKVALTQLNDKNFYLPNGISSLFHGHPALTPIYNLMKGKDINVILTREFEEKSLEEELKVIRSVRRLDVNNSIWNSKVYIKDNINNFTTLNEYTFKKNILQNYI